MIGAIGLALLLNEVCLKLATRIYQTVIFFPFIISWVIVGYFSFALLNYETGLVNAVVRALGVEPISWYNSPQYWLAILTITSLWKGVGYGSVVYLAAMLGINQEYYEAAMKVLELLNTNVEIYNTLAKGIEGRHWEWADKANLVIKPGPNNADYNPNTDWEFGNQFLAYYIDPKQAEIKAWEATYELNTTSPPSAAMGFNFNAEPVKTELANLAAVTGELSGPLTSGLVDPATALPDYLERLNQAGIQAVIEEAQRQLNEWAAKK